MNTRARHPARVPRTRRKDTSERALVAAEKLLIRGGYANLSLDGVADALGIRTPSLYHHFPGGKEELVLSVAERNAVSDGARVVELLASATDPVEKLRAVAGHFGTLTGHPLRHALSESRRDLSPRARARMQARYAKLVEAPLLEVIEQAIAGGEFRRCNPVAAVRAFLMLMLSLGEFEADDPMRANLPDFLVDLFADGLRAPTTRGARKSDTSARGAMKSLQRSTRKPRA